MSVMLCTGTFFFVKINSYLVARIVLFDTAGLHLLTFRILESRPSKHIELDLSHVLALTKLRIVLSNWLFHDGGRYHIETSPLICRANQRTGFYMITASIIKELKKLIKKFNTRWNINKNQGLSKSTLILFYSNFYDVPFILCFHKFWISCQDTRKVNKVELALQFF